VAARRDRDQACWFSAKPRSITECHDCGLQQRVPSLDYGDVFCVRCGRRLRRLVRGSLGQAFALAVAGLIMLGLALFEPFITVEVAGRQHRANLLSGIWTFAEQGFHELAFFVMLNTIVAPLVSWTFIALAPLLLLLRRPPHVLVPMALWVERLTPWAMVEVYLLALFVSYTKLADLAQVEFGIAVYAMAGMMLVTVMLSARFDHGAFWEAMERKGVTHRPPGSDVGRSYSCHGCGLLLRLWSRPGHDLKCPRCHSAVHQRKPQSMARAWALLIAAAVFYIPANAYPVMTVVSLGKSYPSTILGGVSDLIELGSWPLAMIIFIASIAVPFLKISAMTFLLVTTHRGTRWRLRDRTRLYRLVETIGRWSMIDIYVVSLMIALVQMGQIATFYPGFGATCFATVVVLTMLAAMSFDPRLMWDRAGMNVAVKHVRPSAAAGEVPA